MSAAILDRARAFEMIAQHLDETKRAEIANAIGDKLLAEIKPSSGGGSHARPPHAEESARQAPSPEEERIAEAVAFLELKGYTKGDLVRAAGRLCDWMKTDAYKTLPHDARLQTWWATERDGRPE